VEPSLQELKVIKEVCTLVARRAARLTCVGIAAIMTQLHTDGTDISVGIDGSVFKEVPHFKEVS